MSLATWARRIWERPIAKRERSAVLAAIVMALLVAATLLATTRPSRHPAAPQRTATTSIAIPAHPVVPARRPAAANPARVAPVAARVAHRFLPGYLAYLYGHAPATAVMGAVPRLVRALRARAPLVPPAMRARHPRVLALRPMPAAPTGMLAISALIGDGELADYWIGLLLDRAHGRLRVNAVESTS
jgi:hypothetical protein